MSAGTLPCNKVMAQTLDTITEQLKTFENNPQIKVGSEPSNIAVNEITNKIYVTNYVSGTVSVIDSDSGRIVKDIGVGAAPNYIAVDSDHNKIYVANGDSNTISVIDGNNDTEIQQISLGNSPEYIAVGGKGKIYVTNSGNNSVSVIDVSHNKKHDVPVGRSPTSIVFDAFTNKIYVANSASNYVSVINAANDTNEPNIPVEGNPNYLAVDPVLTKIYVTNSGSNTVSVINPTTDKNEHHDIPLEGDPIYLAVDHDKIYVVNTDSFGNNTLDVIDGNTDNKIERISLGNVIPFPTDIALGAGPKLYGTNKDNNSVSVINATYKSGEIHTTEPHDIPLIPVGKYPSYIAVNNHTHMIYVANVKSDTVSVIDGFSDKLAAGVTLKIHPGNSGTIMCDNNEKKEEEYPTNIYLYIDVGTNCTVQPNKDFQFSGWVENLNGNSTIPLRDSSGTLTVNRYGTFTANFKPLPPTIPPEFLYLLLGIILSSLFGWSIPSIMGWVKAKTQRKYLKECMNQIGNLGRTAIEEMITAYYIDGKINESQHKLLKDKISENYENVKGSN